MKHTPEPWEHGGDLYGYERQYSFDAIYASGVMIAETLGGLRGSHNNAARIVACVNACEGMTDPAAEIARKDADLREALDALKGVMAECGKHFSDSDTQRRHAEGLAILRKHRRAV